MQAKRGIQKGPIISVALPSFRVLSICTGYGGIDLGLGLAIPSSRAVCFIEIEAYAAALLVQRMSEGFLAPAPIWSDAKTFDGAPWRGAVDCVVAGYPCQPWSIAGKRQGADDPRHLWPAILRIIEECAPPCVFIENVANHLVYGFADVRADLRRLGYRVEAGLFSASEVGAPHRRKRLFALAYNDGLRQQQSNGLFGIERERSGDDRAGLADARRGASEAGSERLRRAPRADADRSGARAGMGHAEGQHDDRTFRTREERSGSANDGDFLADANDAERRSSEQCGGGCGEGIYGKGQTNDQFRERLEILDDAHRERGETWVAESEISRRSAGPECSSDWSMEHADDDGSPESEPGCCGPNCGGNGAYFGPEIEGASGVNLPAFPPGPDARFEWERILDFDPSLEPAICRIPDGRTSRVDELRALGNGVVPVVAAYAFCTLADLFEEGE